MRARSVDVHSRFPLPTSRYKGEITLPVWSSKTRAGVPRCTREPQLLHSSCTANTALWESGTECSVTHGGLAENIKRLRDHVGSHAGAVIGHGECSTWTPSSRSTSAISTGRPSRVSSMTGVRPPKAVWRSSSCSTSSVEIFTAARPRRSPKTQRLCHSSRMGFA